MAYLLDEKFDLEIQAEFSIDQTVHTTGDDTLKKLLKNHKKLTIKYLNRKWDISTLKSHIEHKVIPRGLRERVVPAAHLHSTRFLDIWRKSCIDRGLEVMRLIVEEELAQLSEIQTEIDNSAQLLEPYKQDQEFEKFNESLKKEVERTQKNFRINKQEKFKQNIADWEKDIVFDPTLQRGRSQSRKSRSRRNLSASKHMSSTDSDEETLAKSVNFLEKSQGGRDTPDIPQGQVPTIQQARRKPPTHVLEKEREKEPRKNSRELRANSRRR